MYEEHNKRQQAIADRASLVDPECTFKPALLPRKSDTRAAGRDAAPRARGGVFDSLYKCALGRAGVGMILI